MPGVDETPHSYAIAVQSWSLVLVEEKDEGRGATVIVAVVVGMVRRAAIGHGCDQRRALVGVIRRLVITHLAAKLLVE